MKLFTVLIPTFLIGGFEFLRHKVIHHSLSMETGNYLITILTLIISYTFATWMFKAIEMKNQRLTKEREMRAIYEERERLAKELHDSIAQTLFLLKVHLKKGKYDEADFLINSIDTQLRQAIFNLRMDPTEQVHFSHRIQNWLEDWNTVSGIDINLNIVLKDNYFTPAEEVILFGVIQEAFINIRKHSEATSITFHFHTDIEEWMLLIEDNGRGFNVNDVGLNRYGLAMLKEKAEKLNSRVEIDSQVNRGTKIIMKGNKYNDKSV